MSERRSARGPVDWLTIPGRLLLIGTILACMGAFSLYFTDTFEFLPPGRYPLFMWLAPIAVGGLLFFLLAAFVLERCGVRIYRPDPQRISANPATSAARWQISQGNAWRWTGGSELNADLNPAMNAFDIDLFSGTAAELRELLVATQAQFPSLTIRCRYDDHVRSLLEQLHRDGFLDWSDAQDPHSSFAILHLCD